MSALAWFREGVWSSWLGLNRVEGVLNSPLLGESEPITPQSSFTTCLCPHNTEGAQCLGDDENRPTSTYLPRPLASKYRAMTTSHDSQGGMAIGSRDRQRL